MKSLIPRSGLFYISHIHVSSPWVDLGRQLGFGSGEKSLSHGKLRGVGERRQTAEHARIDGAPGD